MKKIGVIAITYEGALHFVRLLCRESESAFKANHHPAIVLGLRSFHEYFDTQADRAKIWPELFRQTALELVQAGAEILVCPANSIFDVVDQQFEQSLPKPLVNIVDAVLHHARDLGLRKLLLLGTNFTVCSNFYAERAQRLGIDLVVPTQSSQVEIHRIIVDQLIHGDIREESVAFIQATIRECAKIDGVILGCTELSLITSHFTAVTTVLDSNLLLAKTALQHAGFL